MKRAEAEVRTVSLGKTLSSPYLKMVLMAVLGVALLLFGMSYGSESGQGSEEVTAGSLTQQEEAISAMVEEVLGAMKGVGEVRVRVTAEMGPQSVYASNTSRSSTTSTETTSAGETRENATENESSQPVTGRFGSSESPLVEKVSPLKIGGCLVVAEGAVSSEVKRDIYNAVSTLLNIPVYKIEVEAMEGGR